MATTSNWNIRFDGAAAADGLSLLGTAIDDLDGDGKKDLVLGANDADNNSRSASGSVYIIYSSNLSSLTGTANTIDLATSTSYNVRFDGASAGDNLGVYSPQVIDIDLDGKKDLLLSARTADVSSRSDAGAVYVVYGHKLDDWTGTGNNVDLATTSNWNLRFDGATASDFIGRSIVDAGDLNNNGVPDLVMGARDTDFNSRSSSGSLYVIYDSIFSGLTGTGNTLDLNDSSKWNLRFDGALGGVNHLFTNGGAGAIADISVDGKNDLIIGSNNEGNNGRSSSGSVYIFSNGFLGSFTGTGNAIDTASSSAWTLRIDGATAGDGIAIERGLSVGDIDNDSLPDLVIGATGADYNSRSNSGSIYVLKNGIFRSLLSGTGNTLDLANTYSTRFDGAAANESCGRGEFPISDFDGDGRNDLVLSCFVADNNSRSNSGSLYVVSSSLLSGWTVSGTSVDLADTANYTVRYDGAADNDQMGYTNYHAEDINGDGKQDLVMGAANADNNSRSNSGSLYLIYNFPHSLSVNESRIETSNTNPRITGSLTASNSVTTISDVQYSLSNASPTASSWTSCSANDGSFNSTSESFTCPLTFAGDATHTVFVRAKDSNGSYTLARNYRFVSLVLDRVALPTFSINAPGYSKDGTVVVDGTYNDDRSGLDNIQVKGIGTKSVTAGLNGASWSVTYANVPDGVYQLSAISYDRAGNEKIVTAGNTTTVDRAAPTLTASATNLTDSSNNSTVEQGVTIEGSVADGYAGLKSVVLTNETTNSTIPLKVTNGTYKSDITLRKGTNTIKVVATDNAGNTSTQTLTIVRNSFISSTNKDIPITDSNGVTKKYKQADVLAGLKQGRTNVFVRSLQDSLKTLGHYTGNITGFFGELTKKAVLAFQKSVEIKQTGVVQAQTLARLDVTKITDDAYLSSIAQSKPGLSKDELKKALDYQLTKDIKAGKQDEEVKFIQKKLYALGYYSGAINGWLNTSTQTAISEFRKDRGLGAGGVDVKLREKLSNL